MKRTIGAVTLLMTAIATHASPGKTGVDCQAIAKAGLDTFAAHYKMEGSMYTNASVLKGLDAYCTVGIGGYLQGKDLSQVLNEAATTLNIAPGAPESTAALLAATTQGYLYASAHAVSQNEKNSSK